MTMHSSTKSWHCCTATKTALTTLFTTVILLYLPFFSFSSSSSTPYYNVYNYDLTTPQFTPDGRLMQVEYASSASTHSSPLLAVPLFLDDKCIGVIMATLAAGKNKQRKGQSRIVEIPIGPPPAFVSKEGNNRGSVVVGLSGVLSDNVALLQHAREDALESWHRSYGLHCLHHQSPSFVQGSSESLPTAALATSAARRIVTSIGDKCQSHSFGGGLRPYGARILVCGVDEYQGVVLGVADPSGSVSIFSLKSVFRKEENNDDTVSNDDDGEQQQKKSRYSVDAMILGGDTKVQSRLRRDVRTRLFDSLHNITSTTEEDRLSMMMIRKAIQSTITTLVEEDRLSNQNDYWNDSGEDKTEEEEDGNTMKSKEKAEHPLLEVVVVTPKNGVHRLSDEQIEKLSMKTSS